MDPTANATHDLRQTVEHINGGLIRLHRWNRSCLIQLRKINPLLLVGVIQLEVVAHCSDSKRSSCAEICCRCASNHSTRLCCNPCEMPFRLGYGLLKLRELTQNVGVALRRPRLCNTGTPLQVGHPVIPPTAPLGHLHTFALLPEPASLSGAQG